MRLNKLYLGLSVFVCLVTGFFLTTKLWGGDDSLIKNSWTTSYFQDSSYRVNISNMIWDEFQNEMFFEIEQSKTTQDVQLKLQVDLIAKDDTIYPIQQFSHLVLEEDSDDSLLKTKYSFSLPLAEWRYIKFTIHTEREGVLSNQSILYADYRELEKSEAPIVLSEWLINEVAEENEEVIEIEEEPSISDEETTEAQEEEETQNTLQQDYVIESEPIILDGGNQMQEEEHQHEEIIETEEPSYTLEDYEHQQQKLNEEIANVQSQLTEQADNQELQNQLSELQMKLAEVQQQIQNLRGE